MGLARSYKEGVHPPALDNIGGFQQGNVALYDVVSTTSGDYQVKLPTGTAPWLSAPFGICDSAGFVTGSGSALGEALSFARQGLWRALLSANQTMTAGVGFMADSGTLGNVVPRTPYSFSAYELGIAEETVVSQTTATLFECYLQPSLKEVVRSITGISSSTLTAATKYILPGYVAVGSAAVPVYVCRFTGEVVRNLGATLLTAPAGSDTVQFSVFKSSDQGATWATTGVTCTITGAAKTASDLVHTASLTAGDMLAIQVISSATTAAVPACSFDIT